MRIREKMNDQSGFTLVEVLMVVVLIAVLSAIVIPKVSGSSDKARLNADIATAHQVKAALDRYQVENGVYPSTETEISASGGTVTSSILIPQYISKLDSTVTQQREGDGIAKGFGVQILGPQDAIPETPDHLIMIYLRSDGSDAEVRAYDYMKNQIWPAEPEAETSPT